MTIKEYFEREKNPVEKYLIHRAGKATIVVPEAEKNNLNKNLLDCKIKSISLDSINGYDEATITIRI
ncbi:hypothetical protein [Faecalibacillus intestinalis]|jgi:hypothetical protein|uniref:hypothetical protein n=1 Tax=Faecalibacillus intestinalis TaxID=1982626 RepID=UPI000E4E8D1F|nr:hypothetical protein [Faecalibacillus intestinalis]MEE1447305.1 hypothetical protein [Faecalibacillus intestinalis]RGG32991.1 hypothetical protein DWY19_01505 [Coprobacillus sp. AF24-1LB]RHO35751.1 hypothetical protein DW202_03060 [Coprobacillus sp. AM17-34]RHP53447.1 hypothetical protein DWZ30_08300 [Coprobacillus sp. AF31-1BH]